MISKGVELDLVALLTKKLTLSSGIGYTHAEFERYPGVMSVNGIIIDEDGNDVPFFPDWTVNVAFDYKHPVWSGGNLIAHLNSNYISERYDSEDLGRNQPARLMSSYSTAYNERSKDYMLFKAGSAYPKQELHSDTFDFHEKIISQRRLKNQSWGLSSVGLLAPVLSADQNEGDCNNVD